MLLGNIALSWKDRVLALKSDCNVYPFSLFLPSFSFGSKSLLRLVLLLTWLFSSSSDDGVKNLANSFTHEGPMRLWGSSWMSCNLSPVSELLLFLQITLAFSACTWFLDPMSHGCLWGNGGSSMFAARYACCDMDQSDTISKIELIPLSFLSSVITNCKNDIQ